MDNMSKQEKRDILMKAIKGENEKNLDDVAVQCKVCANVNVVKVDKVDLDNWQAGELIQNAMPYLTPSERELFITGICGDCFEKMFG